MCLPHTVDDARHRDGELIPDAARASPLGTAAPREIPLPARHMKRCGCDDFVARTPPAAIGSVTISQTYMPFRAAVYTNPTATKRWCVRPRDVTFRELFEVADFLRSPTLAMGTLLRWSDPHPTSRSVVGNDTPGLRGARNRLDRPRDATG
jgi:hypothetical protein